jgi:hypothetical protein
VFVLGRVKVEELKKHKDVRLVPLYPLCDVTPTEIKQQAFDWAEQIRAASELRKQEKKSLLAFLGGAISHRIRKLTFNAVDKLIGGFVMLDTPIGQELKQMRVQEGIQHILLKQVATRFGKVPEDLRQKIVAIKDTKELDRIGVALMNIRSLTELKKAL